MILTMRISKVLTKNDPAFRFTVGFEAISLFPRLLDDGLGGLVSLASSLSLAMPILLTIKCQYGYYSDHHA